MLIIIKNYCDPQKKPNEFQVENHCFSATADEKSFATIATYLLYDKVYTNPNRSKNT